MNRGDLFWIADAPEEGWVNSAGEAVELCFGDYSTLEPMEVKRAVFIPNIWVVLEEKNKGVVEHKFSTKKEAEQFCQKMRSKENQEKLG